MNYILILKMYYKNKQLGIVISQHIKRHRAALTGVTHFTTTQEKIRGDMDS